MPGDFPSPTVEDVERIVQIRDPVIRNLQITQCYHELSAVLAARTGQPANWCTFATWASKQAGQTIRQEDLLRLLESRLRRSPSMGQAVEDVAASATLAGGEQVGGAQALALNGRAYTTAIARASDAVSRGNKKVFEEIGREFARFYATCLDDPAPDGERVVRFCEELRPGDPPEGQGALRQAFTHYAQAIGESDAKTRAELILLANILIGFHEQTRLQPEIAESLDAGFTNSLLLTRQLLAAFFPSAGWLAVAHLYLRRLLGRPTALDQAIGSLRVAAQLQLRRTITETMMTITLPSGARLRLGQDLAADFPASLKVIASPELRSLLAMHDPTPDSLLDSGAADWGQLPDRLHFIADFFRCYQENQELLAPPFTPEQVVAFRAGQVPAGRL
jgi:hypothetical protein